MANVQRELTRPEPEGPPQAYKTYSIETPLGTHWRKADCEEVGCLNHHHGFKTEVDIATMLGQQQAEYIEKRSGRQFAKDQFGTVVTYTFPPGTECFALHRVRADRPPLLLVRTGDWRQYIGRPFEHKSPESWVDDFATHQDKLEKQIGG